MWERLFGKWFFGQCVVKKRGKVMGKRENDIFGECVVENECGKK